MDYITKPLQFEEIHARVETHLNLRRMQIHLEELVNEKVRELTESENRFRTLHNATFSGICIHDKGIILDCNQGLIDLTGYTREELIGMSGVDLIAPEWRARVMERNVSSEFDQLFEVKGLRKNETTYHLGVQSRNIPYKGRTVLITELRDISKHKQAEENLRLANETLEQRVLQRTLELEKAHAQMIVQEKMASIGHLAAGIAHELNNPLCFIAADINALSEYLEDIIDVLQAYRQWTATIQNKIEFLPETLSLQNKEAEVELDYILDDIPILLKETRSGFERINRIIQSLCSFSQVNRNADLTNIQHQHRY